MSAAMLCQGCGEPNLGRADRRHHSSACRKLAFRRRQREREAPELGELSEAQLVGCLANGARTNWRAVA
jgi:hypothetical protein